MIKPYRRAYIYGLWTDSLYFFNLHRICCCTVYRIQNFGLECIFTCKLLQSCLTIVKIFFLWALNYHQPALQTICYWHGVLLISSVLKHGYNKVNLNFAGFNIEKVYQSLMFLIWFPLKRAKSKSICSLKLWGRLKHPSGASPQCRHFLSWVKSQKKSPNRTVFSDSLEAKSSSITLSLTHPKATRCTIFLAEFATGGLWFIWLTYYTVSYTHLTLPTKRIV